MQLVLCRRAWTIQSDRVVVDDVGMEGSTEIGQFTRQRKSTMSHEPALEPDVENCQSAKELKKLERLVHRLFPSRMLNVH